MQFSTGDLSEAINTGVFEGIFTQPPVFFIDRTTEQIAYSLGIERTAIDFIPQKIATFPQA
jgi:hypothetical protein